MFYTFVFVSKYRVRVMVINHHKVVLFIPVSRYTGSLLPNLGCGLFFLRTGGSGGSSGDSSHKLVSIYPRVSLPGRFFPNFGLRY